MSEEILHVSHLKPYSDEDNDETGEEVDDVEDTRPPWEAICGPVTSDPLEVSAAPPSVTCQVKKRPRGRPRKTVHVVKGAVPRKARVATRATVETKNPRGRPKDFTKRLKPQVN